MDAKPIDIFNIAFRPNGIAIVGASDEPYSSGHMFMYHLLNYGYPGNIYPVNPNKQTVFGLKVYPDLISIPDPVDYVICCLPASKIPDLLIDGSAKGVKLIHFFTGRLSETGHQEAIDLEAEILQLARKSNIRLLGPNCMGIYNPLEGITFESSFPKESGTVGVLSQSGGAASLFVRYGELQGLRFSKVISYGNALDLDESDFLRYLAHDDETRVIAMYIEGVKDGGKFLNALRDAMQTKPVVAIKGGRGVVGAKAAVSHTAAIAGSDIIWETVFRQFGVIQAQDVNELVDLLVAFSLLPPIKGNRAGVIGGSGGTTVMFADICEKAGIAMPPLPLELDMKLKAKAPELYGWLGNPVDYTVVIGSAISVEEILNGITRSPDFDFIISSINEGSPYHEGLASSSIAGEVEAAITVFKGSSKPMVAVLSGAKVGSKQTQHWRWKLIAELRTRLIDAGIPTYSTITEAAKTLHRFVEYWQKRAET